MNWNSFKKSSKKKRVQIIAIVATVVFVILAVGGLLTYKYFVQERMDKKISALNEETRLIREEYQRISREIDEAEAEFREAMQQNASRTMLIFAQCYDNLYKSVYPAMRRNAMTGVFVVSEECMIGGEKCITADQCNEMLNGGWMMAISAPGKGKDIDEYMSSIRTRLAKNGIEFPEIFYFPVGAFDGATYEKVKSDFKTVLYCLNDDTGGQVFPTMTDIDSLMVSPYMYTSLTTPIWLKYSQYMQKGNSCSIATGMAVESGNYDSTRKGLDTSISDLYDIEDTLTREKNYYRPYSAYRVEQLKEDTDLADIKKAYEEKITALTERRDELYNQLSLYYNK